jgi:hypothetical protein
MLFMIQLGKTVGILLIDCNFIFKDINCELIIYPYYSVKAAW